MAAAGGERRPARHRSWQQQRQRGRRRSRGGRGFWRRRGGRRRRRIGRRRWAMLFWRWHHGQLQTGLPSLMHSHDLAARPIGQRRACDLLERTACMARPPLLEAVIVVVSCGWLLTVCEQRAESNPKLVMFRDSRTFSIRLGWHRELEGTYLRSRPIGHIRWRGQQAAYISMALN